MEYAVDVDNLLSFIRQAENSGRDSFRLRKDEHSLSVSLPFYPEGILFTYVSSKERKRRVFKINVVDEKIYSTDFSFNYDETIFMDVTEPDKLVSEYPHISNILEIFFPMGLPVREPCDDY